MNKFKLLLCCLIFIIAMLLPEITAAQGTFPAAGSLESSGDGLWNYYRGMTKNTVKRKAPQFEKINDEGRYLLDYTNIKGVELYLVGDFDGNKLAILQVMTPFPDYTSCKKDVKETSRSYAEVGAALMGVTFDAKKQCTTIKDNGGTVVCTGEDFVCVYLLCPGSMWTYACSVLPE